MKRQSKTSAESDDMLLDHVDVFTDGGSRGNPGPAAIGVIVLSPSGSQLAQYRECIGDTTNNQAEYSALVRGLAIASRFTNKEVRCHSDSELMVKQLKGSYKVKNPGIATATKLVREAEKPFKKVIYSHHPRTNPNIKKADALVNLALDERKFMERKTPWS